LILIYPFNIYVYIREETGVVAAGTPAALPVGGYV
jgi:hypothetical protein